MSEQFQKTITEFIKAQQVQAQLQKDQLMKNQQEFLLLLSQNFKSSGVLPKTAEISEEFRMETLGNGITEFHYDPENNITFDAWYQRYESLFLEDAQKLSDPAKVRLLLRKLDTQVHQQYVNLILPKEPKEINFEDTVVKLKGMFGKKTSIFNTRYQCMKLTKSSTEDFVAYAAKVNKFCEEFDIRKITVDQFKCLIFVCGLQSGNDSDVRTKLLSIIDGKDSKPLKLEDLTSECQRILNLKQDTAMIERCNATVVNAISQEKKFSSPKKSHDSKKNNHKEQNIRSNGDIPKTACWFCGQMHIAKNCTYQNHTCQNCRKVGHKEGYCGRNKRRNYKRFNRNNIISQVNSITERKYLHIIINGIQVNLQIDTASDITIVSEETWIRLGKPQCFPTQNIVKNASGQQLPLISEFTCNIVFNNQSYSGKCFVTPVKQLNLLGIDWITKFGLWDVPLNSICAEAAKSPPKIPFSSWSTPTGPWQRLHIDFAGPIEGDSFFIIVDAYSKWPEIVSTKNTTTAFIIRTLEEIFARFGNPQTLVSDNASQFCSEHFQIFCKHNGIDHIRTPPYHPQSNGQVERFVDTFKRALKKIGKGGQPLGQQIQKFLATYRTTPSRYTPNGTSPAEVLIGRKVRTTFDLLLPPSQEGVQPLNDNYASSSKSFKIGDMVYCQVHRNNRYQWKPGRITNKIGNVMYEISLNNSQRILRAHANQLKKRYVEGSEIENDSLPLDILMESFELSRNPRGNIPSTTSTESIDISPNLLIPEVFPDHVVHESQQGIEVSAEPQREVRPVRTKRIPSYLKDFELRRGDVGNS